LIGTLPSSARFVLNLGPMVLSMVVLTSLFYFVPNTKVRRRDAIAGGLIASVAFELGKRGFTAYLLKVPTYKAVYGTFAAFPSSCSGSTFLGSSRSPRRSSRPTWRAPIRDDPSYTILTVRPTCAFVFEGRLSACRTTPAPRPKPS
jgi:hypothetical protein